MKSMISFSVFSKYILMKKRKSHPGKKKWHCTLFLIFRIERNTYVSIVRVHCFFVFVFNFFNFILA